MGNSKSKKNKDDNTPQPLKVPEVTIPILELNGVSSQIIQKDKEDVIKFLCKELPADHTKKWTLLFASQKHGKSYNRFCYHVTASGPTLVFIRDTNGHVFGGFAAETWKDKYPKFYGKANSFVFKLQPGSPATYKATGRNDNYQYLNQGTETLFNGVGQGGQMDFFAWAIKDDFETGQCRGNPSSTFGNPTLASSEDWIVDYVEVWEVKELEELTYEQEKMLKKKNKNKSVLDDEDNADKVITSYLGHNFASFELPEDPEKDDKS